MEATSSKFEEDSGLLDLLGGRDTRLMGHNGSVVAAKSALRNKAVLLYFAEKTPACMSFNMLLSKFCDFVLEIDRSIEVLFVSMDRSPQEQLEYFRQSNMHDTWLMLIWSPQLRALAETLQVTRPPELLLLGRDGRVLSQDAQETIIEMTMDDRGRVLELAELKRAALKTWGVWRELAGVDPIPPVSRPGSAIEAATSDDADLSFVDMVQQMICSCVSGPCQNHRQRDVKVSGFSA